MNIHATGVGRRGFLNDGVGTLTFKNAKGFEAKRLKLLFEEVEDGNFGFWACLIWAAREKKLTKAEEKVMNGVIDRLGKKFELI